MRGCQVADRVPRPGLTARRLGDLRLIAKSEQDLASMCHDVLAGIAVTALHAHPEHTAKMERFPQSPSTLANAGCR